MICIGKTKCTSEKGLLVELRGPPRIGGEGEGGGGEGVLVPSKNLLVFPCSQTYLSSKLALSFLIPKMVYVPFGFVPLSPSSN